MSEAVMDAPVPKGQPRGLWVLILTETFERFSHYGMRALLILYLTAGVEFGGLGLDKPRAAAIFGGYLLSIYLFGLSGGQIADRFLGAKRTIVLGGLFIAAGQLLLQIRTLNGLIVSLMFIAVGTCLLKPNVSASVGKLFTKEDPRRDAAFTYEYMGINIGATIAPIICGFMVDSPIFHGFLGTLGLTKASAWAWAFGVSGVGMMFSLVNFVLRNQLVNDVNLPEGQKEAAPVGYGFVAMLLVVLLGFAYMVIASPSWPIQLGAGAVASFGAMLGVQALIKRGIIPSRTPITSASGEVEDHKLTPEDWSRLKVVGMMLVFSLSFWFVFQQAGSSLNLFARDYTNRTTGGIAAFLKILSWVPSGLTVLMGLLGVCGSLFSKAKIFKNNQPVRKVLDKIIGVSSLLIAVGSAVGISKMGVIPAAWFQTINAFFIVALGPVFAWFWSKRSGKWPSSPQKFALALFMAAAGFYLLVPGAMAAQAVPGTITKVSMGWLVGVYFIHTIGELCLSPVGLAYVSRLAPKHLSGQLMGIWFFTTGCGSFLAGKAAGYMDAVPLWQLFAFCATVALVAGAILYFIVSRIIFRIMGGHS